MIVSISLQAYFSVTKTIKETTQQAARIPVISIILLQQTAVELLNRSI